MSSPARNPLEFMAQIMGHATVVFDGKENALAWLGSPNGEMGGRTPYSVIEEGDSMKIVQLDQQLSALEHGVYP